MRKLMLALCLVLGFSIYPASLRAQKIVSGAVYDSSTRQPLVGATVYLKGFKEKGVMTDSQGRYSLHVPDDSKELTMEVSFVGYETQRRKLTPLQFSKTVDVFMKESESWLNEVVVTGTRTPRLLKDSPILTRVFTENDIKKVDATHIGELLQSELPGIEFSYSMNQQVALNMQGVGGNSVLFLVDGERIAGETLDNIDYNRLSLDNVEQIEIIKGAASSLYGSNAIGGVVNILSKTPVQPWSVNLNSRFASHNQKRYGGSVAFNRGRLNSTTNVQHVSAGELDLKKKGGAYEKVMGYSTINIKERLQYLLTDNLKLTGRAGYFLRERESQPSLDDRYRGFSGGLKGDLKWNGNNILELGYAFDQYDKSDYQKNAKLDVLKYRNVQHITRGLYTHSFDSSNILTVGGDYMRDYLMSYQFKDGGSREQHVLDFFAQYDWTPLEFFNVISALRYDYFSDGSIGHISPKIGLMLSKGHFNFRGSYAGGFRAPSLKEKYMAFDMASVFMIYGNRDLKVESSHNYSLSGEYIRSNYSFSLNGFHNLVDNRISIVWNNDLKGMQYVNIKSLRIYGVDANASARFAWGLGARLSYSYLHEKSEKGKPNMSQTRPHTATVRLEYGRDWTSYGFNIALSGRFLSKLSTHEYASMQSFDETVRVTYPGYTIWKLSLIQTIKKGVRVNLGIDNLFDYVPDVYYSNSPYTTGPEVSVGVSVDIDKFF